MRAAMPVREITTREYAGFQRLVADASGIALNASKRQLLVGRVARVMRERGITTYGAYLDAIRSDTSGHELVLLLDLVTTNETSFFRERTHFEYLTQTCCPAWREDAESGRRSRIVRVWSAACSTGQEPYSIAMTLRDHLPQHEGWSIEILASDLSTRVLETAARGEYAMEKSDAIPAPYLRRFMLRGVGAKAGTMRVSQELRALTRFCRVNLVESLQQVSGQFDLVFCSNALIYFSRTGRTQVVERLARKLAVGGKLFVGHAESLHEHRTMLRSVVPTVYSLVNDHISEP